jgi:hypothetical protein
MEACPNKLDGAQIGTEYPAVFAVIKQIDATPAGVIRDGHDSGNDPHAGTW